MYRRNGKYSNKKVRVGDDVFDSKREYKRYLELLELEKAGEISNLQRQVKFILIPRQTETIERYSPKTGKRLKDKTRTVEHECAYFADFVYEDKAGNTIVEDTKGMRTTDYIIKRKLMLFVHGLKINEI